VSCGGTELYSSLAAPAALGSTSSKSGRTMDIPASSSMGKQFFLLLIDSVGRYPTQVDPNMFSSENRRSYSLHGQTVWTDYALFEVDELSKSVQDWGTRDLVRFSFLQK